MQHLDLWLFWANILMISSTLQFLTLVTLEGLDFLTGTILAIRDKDLNSTVSFIGISRKLMTLSIVLILGSLFETAGVDYLASTLVYAYLLPQVYSLTENLTKLGIPLPDKITQYFDDNKTGK